MTSKLLYDDVYGDIFMVEENGRLPIALYGLPVENLSVEEAILCSEETIAQCDCSLA